MAGPLNPTSSQTEVTSTNLPDLPPGSSPSSNDSPSPVVTCYQLTGDNYLEWSQSVKIFLSGRGRLGYVTGTKEQPTSTAATYSTRVQENNQVMSWILNSMAPNIDKNFLLYPTAAEIWTVVQETYSSVDNISEIYGIEGQAASLKQENLTVTVYYVG
ncbi:hypothetical protein GQ457_08G032140 [Hibiscus cannabinus]